MYEKILVPLDGSELAEVALPYAEELAGRLGSEIILITVLLPGTGSDEDWWYPHLHHVYLQKMVDIVKQDVQKILGELAAKETKVESVVLVGYPAEEIVDYASREKIDLIVMSTHGRSGIKRWTLGSVADKVVRAAKEPVLLIRAKGARLDVHKKRVLAKALVPLDGSKKGESAIPYIMELAAKLKTEVILFQVLALGYQTVPGLGYGWVVYSEQQMETDKALARDYLAKVGARLKRRGVAVESEVRFGNVAEEIIKFADEMHVDVVVMSTHGRSGIGRWVFGSVAERLLYQGNNPLLLVREPRVSKK
jgi:nucleotide-binding universal stress UspA family protein